MRFRLLLSLLAVALLGAAAIAGPIRDWVRDHRPGVIIPKKYNAPIVPGSPQIQPTPGCPCQPVCPCPPQACPGGQCPAPTNPDTVRSALPHGVVYVETQPRPGNDCPGGS